MAIADRDHITSTQTSRSPRGRSPSARAFGGTMDRYFPHEKLDCYQLALGVSRWFRQAAFPSGEADLRNQGKRAADSVVLNLAEGTRMTGRNRQKHFRYAEGSAAEACAALDIVEIEGGPARQQELRRVAAMVRRLR